MRAGHSSVSVVLDRYGHLLPGTEERVTDALDEMAYGGADCDGDAARVILPRPPRGRALTLSQISDGQMRPHLRFRGGRYGTRTHDLCRVKAAL